MDYMDAVSYSDLRQNLKSFMDKVYNDHDPLIITRKNNENLVLISIDEYNSLMETNYLLSNEANAEHLKKSIEQYESGKFIIKELLENE
jgi:antitoxin YefM